MKYTVDDMMPLGLCYHRSEIETLFDGRESLSAEEIATLDIPLHDRIWYVGYFVGRADPTRRVARRIIADVLPLWKGIVPPIVKEWVRTGDEKLVKQTWTAALTAVRTVSLNLAAHAVWLASEDAVRSPICAADRAAAARAIAESGDALIGPDVPVWVAASEEYLGWMIDYLRELRSF